MTKITRPGEGNEYTNVDIINCNLIPNDGTKINPKELIEMNCWIAHRDEIGIGHGKDYEVVHQVTIPYETVNARYIDIDPNDSQWHIATDISNELSDYPTPATCNVYKERNWKGNELRRLYCRKTEI